MPQSAANDKWSNAGGLSDRGRSSRSDHAYARRARPGPDRWRQHQGPFGPGPGRHERDRCPAPDHSPHRPRDCNAGYAKLPASHRAARHGAPAPPAHRPNSWAESGNHGQARARGAGDRPGSAPPAAGQAGSSLRPRRTVDRNAQHPAHRRDHSRDHSPVHHPARDAPHAEQNPDRQSDRGNHG